MKKHYKISNFLAILFILCLFNLIPTRNLLAAESELPPIGQKAKVTFDRYSLMIDGVRTPIYSGEFEYWRLPSPSLWRDVMQKMKAEGFNAVTIYFNWGYHSPKEGVYDFSGVRDVDKLLTIAEEVGIYVIARPGPYINAETDAGGFPDWLLTQKGRARSSDADYTKSYKEWLDHIDPIIAKHQITNGGSVILYQIENEYTGWHRDSQYMEDLKSKVKADGIDVPTFHNDKSGPQGTWANGKGAPDMYAFDRYPGIGNIGALPNTFEDPHTKGWGAKSPIFLAELGNGWFDPWAGRGYDYWRNQRGTSSENIINKHIIGEGGTIISSYMTYGGTSWGYLPFPGGYTSYDYGAAINEQRQLDDKTAQQKKIGLMLQSVKPIAKTDRISEQASTNNVFYIIERENPDNKTKFYFVRHNKTNSTGDDTYSLPIKTDEVNTKVSVRINGQTSKVITANYNFGKQHLVYSTNEIFTQFSNDNEDTLVVYSDKNDPNQTVLKYDTEPEVSVETGKVNKKWDEAKKTLTLTNQYDGLANVQIKSKGGSLRLIMGSYEQMNNLWQQKTSVGTILVNGPYLLRKAEVQGKTLSLSGDTNSDTNLAVYCPADINEIRWNSQKLTMKEDAGWFNTNIPGVDKAKIKLPELKDWQYHDANPESNLNFDDSTWQVADKESSNSITKFTGKKVLFADDYGFHHGNVWYRGHFTSNGHESNLKLNGITGNYGAYSAWLNGHFLGSCDLEKEESKEQDFGIDPAWLRKNQDNVVSVLVANMGHDEDGNNKDSHKTARGLISANLQRKDGTDTEITWKLQGNIGGEQVLDSSRGSYNLGGLYGERHGWYLPGFDDSKWEKVTLPDSRKSAGVGWYNTSFDLNMPENYDVPISLEISDDTFGTNGAKYRAYIYINGWLYGQYINNAGPQKDFYLPAGLLNEQGHNLISIAVWSLDNQSTKLGKVSLISNGIYNSSNQVEKVKAATYQDIFGKIQENNSAVNEITKDTSNVKYSENRENNTNSKSKKWQSKLKRVMHNAYLYDKKGQKILSSYVKAGTKVLTYGKVLVHRRKFYRLSPNKYIVASNIDGTFKKLKHNAYIYNRQGNKISKKILSKKEKILIYGGKVLIRNKVYFVIGLNKFVKAKNFT